MAKCFPGFNIEIEEHDIWNIMRSSGGFTVDHPIRQVLEQAQLASYLLMSSLFYDPTLIVSIIGIVTMCPNSLVISKEVIHEVTGLPHDKLEVPIVARQDRKLIAEQYCLEMTNANTSSIRVDGLKDKNLRWITQFIAACLLRNQKDSYRLLLVQCPTVDLLIADNNLEFPRLAANVKPESDNYQRFMVKFNKNSHKGLEDIIPKLGACILSIDREWNEVAEWPTRCMLDIWYTATALVAASMKILLAAVLTLLPGSRFQFSVVSNDSSRSSPAVQLLVATTSQFSVAGLASMKQLNIAKVNSVVTHNRNSQHWPLQRPRNVTLLVIAAGLPFQSLCGCPLANHQCRLYCDRRNKFAYNNSQYMSTGPTELQSAYGHSPIMPSTGVILGKRIKISKLLEKINGILEQLKRIMDAVTDLLQGKESCAIYNQSKSPVCRKELHNHTATKYLVQWEGHQGFSENNRTYSPLTVPPVMGFIVAFSHWLEPNGQLNFVPVDLPFIYCVFIEK
eukprot:Gb_04179 [translate_table: standard]